MDVIDTNKDSITSGVQPTSDFVADKKDWIQKAVDREATPKPERKETVEDFCKLHDIDTSTYHYQMRKKENKKRIVEIWLNEAINGGNEVLTKLKDNALAGKEKSIEMYLKFVLNLAENLDITSGGKPIVLPSEIIKQNAIDSIPKTDSE